MEPIQPTTPAPTPVPVQPAGQSPLGGVQAPMPTKSSNGLIIFLSFALILVCLVAGYFFWQVQTLKQKTNSNPSPSPVATEGQATPTSDPTVGWKLYTNEKYGFEFKYPSKILVNLDQKEALLKSQTVITVLATPITEIVDEPLGFTEEVALKDQSALITGKYGEHLDFSIPESEKVISLDKVKAKEYMVTRRFEVCDVTFERTVIFYRNNVRFIIRYNGPKSLASGLTDYFVDDASCNGSIWKEGNTFYSDLMLKKADPIIQNWFNDFDQILSTFKFVEPASAKNNDYYQITKISLPNTWTERGIPLMKNSIREFNSTDICREIIVSYLGVAGDLSEFIKKYYKLSSEPQLYSTQYQINSYLTKTIPAMNAEEMSNTFVLSGSNVYLVTVGITSQKNSPTCKASYDSEIKSIIESVRFKN